MEDRTRAQTNALNPSHVGGLSATTVGNVVRFVETVKWTNHHLRQIRWRPRRNNTSIVRVQHAPHCPRHTYLRTLLPYPSLPADPSTYTRSARMSVPALNRRRAPVFTPAKITNGSRESTEPWRSPCFIPNHSEYSPSSLHTRVHMPPWNRRTIKMISGGGTTYRRHGPQKAVINQ